MTTRFVEELPAAAAALFRTVDPLRRPAPFDLEQALDVVLGEAAPAERSRLAVGLAEALLPDCTRCDVAYTYNVLRLVEQALDASRGTPTPELVARAHCAAARARAFHLVGEKTTNLQHAHAHLALARSAGADAAAPAAWAAALLDVARASELAGDDGAGALPDAMYAEILALTAAATQDVRTLVAARADTAPAPGADDASDIDALEALLAPHEGTALPPSLAPAATRLGESYLARAERGDGARARQWLQAAERCLYYSPPRDPSVVA
ncbi:MAG TPA: hypothetical protein VEA99_18705, partial [Gemmatimonadaceae bacterium]|nr:hypothetical protein [Gemmatimonadaceae bacterium]